MVPASLPRPDGRGSGLFALRPLRSLAAGRRRRSPETNPGQESTIHDHAGALNAIRVYAGELTSRTFIRAGGASLGLGPVMRDLEERVAADARMVGLDRGGIHQLANTSADDLVTIHVYAPALMELNVYSTTSALVERRPLRYTLADDLD